MNACTRLFVFFAIAVAISKVKCMECNGLPDLCDLQINQATFPGTHNSGSGFDGLLRYWSDGLVPSCFYRNQGKSFTDQLNFGIRYFDIDTCYGNSEVLNCHCGKYLCAYTGNMEKALGQIDKWMRNHPGEVIVIHFNRNAQIKYRGEIAIGIEKLLLKFWDPNNSTLSFFMNTHYKKNFMWPTLGDAVRNQQRIFVFMDNNLGKHIQNNNDWLVVSNGIIQSTWKTNPVSSSCSGITSNAKAKCNTQSEFIELSAFGSYGLCTWDMAYLCSKWLGEAIEECSKLRPTSGTVNFPIVDWAASQYKGAESVVTKAKLVNQRNIKKFLNRDITIPEEVGCSYHPGWFYNYCWKYCAEYGWCWTEVYCGKDEDICKKQSYTCHGKCGY